MWMYTYRTVNMLHEFNDRFPIVSMRFPSKSLQETHHETNTQRQNQSIRRRVAALTRQLLIYWHPTVLTASSISAFPDRCHPASSESCSAKPFQSERRDITRGSALSIKARATHSSDQHTASQHQTVWSAQRTSHKMTTRWNRIKTHNKTSEFSPEKVIEEIWWMLLFSRIL